MPLNPEALCFTAKGSPGYLIRRVSQLIGPRAVAVFAGQDLTLSQWIALKLVGDGQADTNVALAKALGHGSGATTRLVDQLEAGALLTRHRRKDDRRVVNLEITPTGEAAVNEMAPKMVNLWNCLLVDFSQIEVDMLIVLLSRLIDRLEMDSSS